MTEHDALIGIVAICAIFLFVGYVAYVDHAAEKYGRYQERKRVEKILKEHIADARAAKHPQYVLLYQGLLNDLVGKDGEK